MAGVRSSVAFQLTMAGAILLIALSLLTSRASGQAGESAEAAQSVAQSANNAAPARLPSSKAALAEPIVNADTTLAGQKAVAWQAPDHEQAGQAHVRYLLLENNVRIAVGLYGFRADRALVRIVTEPRPGKPIYHLSAYLDHARSLHDHGAVTAEGQRVLVTASTTGKLALETDLLNQAEQAPANELVTAGLARIEKRDQRLAQATISPPQGPLFSPDVWARREAQRRTIQPPPVAGGSAAPSGEAATQPVRQAKGSNPTPSTAPATSPSTSPTTTPAPGAVAATQPVPVTGQGAEQNTVAGTPSPTLASPTAGILPTTGTLRFNADRVVYEPGQGESYLMLIGDVRVFYEDRQHNREVSLKTERAVLFLAGKKEAQGPAEFGGQVDAGSVAGVYLEDNAVITSGAFTVRAPRMYYDLRLNQAILLQAVMYTYDVRRHIPLYMRADVVRQTSRQSFEARQALVTTSAFAEPHFAIGASQLTMERRELPGGGVEQWFTAKNTTFRAGGIPLFYWPYMTAETENVPIKSVSFGHSSQNGFEIGTRWNLFALLGRQKPDGVDADLALDYRGDHGPATGVDVDYAEDGMRGRLESYLLPQDNGTDEISDRQDIEPRWRHTRLHSLAAQSGAGQ